MNEDATARPPPRTTSMLEALVPVVKLAGLGNQSANSPRAHRFTCGTVAAMTTEFRGDAIKPKNIHADRPARTLTLEWADGHASTFDLAALRWLCPCAFCRGEAGQPGWLDSNPTLSAEQLQLSDMTLVGHYALQPHWADGHSSGFYSFEHLRRNCPCADDSARRLAAEAPGEEASAHAHD